MTKKPINSDLPIEALLAATGVEVRSEFETQRTDPGYVMRRDAAIGQAVAAFALEQELQSVSRAGMATFRERVGEFFTVRPRRSLQAMSGAAFACTVLFAVTLTGRESSVSPIVPIRKAERQVPLRADVGSEAMSAVNESEFGSTFLPDSVETTEDSLLGSVGPVVEEVVETAPNVDVFANPDPPVKLDLSDVELAYEDGFDIRGLEGVGVISDEDLFLMEDYSDEFPIV